MKLGTLACAALAATLSAGGARAADHALFSNTNIVQTVTLRLDGITPFVATDTGWVNDQGLHQTLNQNYLTGSYTSAGSSNQYNSYFTFVLGALKPVSPYTSATITFDSGDSIGSGPYALSLFDVDAGPLALDAERQAGDAVGQSIFQDLGGGTLYGAATLAGPYVEGQSIVVSLNDTFVSRLNAGLLQTFSIGGTLSPTTPSAAPEPASWALMLLGFGAIGGTMRRRPLPRTA